MNLKVGSDEWFAQIGVEPYYRDASSCLFLGSCYDIVPKLGKFDLLHSDPPYGIGFVHSGGGGTIKGSKSGVKYNTKFGGVEVIGDDKPFDPAFMMGVADKKVLWGANHYCDKLPGSAGWFMWDKRCMTGSNDQSDAEMAWSTGIMGTVRIFYHMWNGMLRDSERGTPRVHPTQKPKALGHFVLQHCGKKLKPGATVIDPFCGGGAFVVAAKECGYYSVGIDLVEDYIKATADRLRSAEPLLPTITAEIKEQDVQPALI